MRRWLAVAALLVLAGLSVIVAPRSDAQILPPLLPPLPAPPAEGNLLADVLGPASATVCDAVATVYGLVGPIASAQLPEALRPLLAEADPYLAVVTYACGYLVSPPSGFVCTADATLNDQLGLLGLPVGLPSAGQVFYETSAGIERALERLGLELGTGVSQQIATALGCGPPEEVVAQPPAALPTPSTLPIVPASPVVTTPGRFVTAPVTVPAVAPAPGTIEVRPGTFGQLGAIRYPVREAAALLLALPLVLLAIVVAVAPRFARPSRQRLSRGDWSPLP